MTPEEIDLIVDRVLQRLEVCGCTVPAGTPWLAHALGCPFGLIGMVRHHTPGGQ